MQAPDSPPGSSPSPSQQRKLRRQRTIYTKQQQQELEKFFKRSRYPTYREREALAARLNLEEHQVQVWFKNHRSKHSRQQGPGACAGPWGPTVCAPAPAPTSPVFQEGLVFPDHLVFLGIPVLPCGPVFSEGPGFCSPPPPSHLEVWPRQQGQTAVAEPQGPGGRAPAPAPVPGTPVLPTEHAFPKSPGSCNPPRPSPLEVCPVTEPRGSSRSQACLDPGQGTQGTVQAAPAPVQAASPVSPQGLYASNFSPDRVVTPGFKELHSPQPPWRDPPPPPSPGTK